MTPFRSASSSAVKKAEDLFKDEPTEALIERAWDHISDLCAGRTKWRMSVPPNNGDSDLLLGEVIRRLKATLR